MTEPLSAARPDFFGKDGFTPFIGQVEDVNDPLMSGRVKVRCVGWHPKERKGGSGGDSLSTDDLPWARVSMPCTHAQQSRIGGKHGLVPGCWVMGFFMDGDEAQDPFVLTTFNFTAKTSSKDNRKDVAGKTGKLSEKAEGYDKVLCVPAVNPNIALKTTEEQGTKGTSNPADRAGDTVLTDATDNECGANLESVSSKKRMKTEKKDDNPEGQLYKVLMGDGLCGKVRHGTEDIKRTIEEKMPSELSRFVYNDQVWDVITGNHINLNAGMLEMAILIAGVLKQTINAKKSTVEELVNRTLKATTIKAIPDRDGLLRIAADELSTILSDIFSVGIQQFIDMLIQIVLGLLQQMNNSAQSDQNNSDNNGGRSGANANTAIQNTRAACLTDSLVVSVDALLDLSIEQSQAASQTITDTIKNEQSSSSDGSSETMTAILTGVASIASLIGGDNPLSFVLNQKFGMLPSIFHKGGNLTQDASTRLGCGLDRLYSTGMGALGSGGGGGSDINRNSNEVYKLTGFGGIPLASETTEVDMIPCEEATSPPDYPKGKNGSVAAISLPSSEQNGAENFINGIPNVVVIIRPGSEYYYENETNKKKVFPCIFIPGYAGTPTPVVHKESGELVAILTTPLSWDNNKPGAPVTIIPGECTSGIVSCGGDYEVVLAGFFIQNTGRGYTNPKINIYDRDKKAQNGSATLVVSEGRVVDVNISDNGTGFCRLPEVTVTDEDGYGALIYPIMNAIPKSEAKASPVAQQMIFCPGKQQTNAIAEMKSAEQMITEASAALVSSILSRTSTPALPETTPSPTPSPYSGY